LFDIIDLRNRVYYILRRRQMSGRHVMVEAVCENCGNTYLVRRTKLLAGKAKYCGKECFHTVQREEAKELYGYEKGKKYLDSSKNIWMVHWYDDSGKNHVTTYPHWYWECFVGEIPDGYRVGYIDEDSLNIDSSNFVLVSYEDIARKNGFINAGRNPSEETRRKMSETRKGKPIAHITTEMRREATKRSWERGVYDTPEIRQKYSENAKKHRGRRATPEAKKHMSQAQLRRYSVDENREKHKESVPRGENHPNWKGGASEEIYPYEFSPRLKSQIRERDFNRCKCCGLHVTTKTGRVHHINANKYNNDPLNLILVCNACHGAIHAQYPVDDPNILAFRSMLYT
jgi:hypothetical protein